MADPLPSSAVLQVAFEPGRAPSENVWEVLYTTRAIRRLRPDPIPDHLLHRLLDAAIRAPSGGNIQGWRFLVVRDPATKEQLGRLYVEAGEEFGRRFSSPSAARADAAPQSPDAARMRRSTAYLAEVPVTFVPCLQIGPRTTIISGASIYPAVWNLQLAARALGLGSTLTTVHRMRHQQIEDLLGIPEGTEIAALVPVGYPLGRFGMGPRQPVENVAFDNYWGAPFVAPSR